MLRSDTATHARAHLDRVARRLDRADPTGAQALLALARDLGRHARPLLSALARDERELAHVAERSYLHGNGFRKLELVRHAGFKVRLHVWQPGTPAEENIHDHRWSFASHVLAGVLVSELFADDPRGDVICAEHAYVARTEREAPSKRLVGTARVRRTERTRRAAGTTYAMRPSVLHRIEHGGDGFVATLMVSAPPIAGGSRLLVEAGRSVDPDVSALPLAPSEVRACVLATLRHTTHGETTWAS